MTRRIVPGSAPRSLRSLVDRLDLASTPTAVERLGERLWVKRDDRTSAIYGGNKVRKLEVLFARAREKGKKRILTLGAAGSHQVVATAIFGAREGFAVEAVLVPQPWSAHAESNLRLALAHGLVAHPSPTWVSGAMDAERRALARDVYFVPLGGSSPLGSLAYVAAADELAEQVARGEMPMPSDIVVALGSGGTAAGLAAGLAMRGFSTRVLGVAVSSPASVLGAMAKRLAFRTAWLARATLRQATFAARKVSVTGAWLGRGYGHATPEGTDAIARAKEYGLTLDATYTAKAFACAWQMAAAARSPSPILFWHTLSSAPTDAPASGLPSALAGLFR